jgi:Uma2 family endonuclease
VGRGAWDVGREPIGKVRAAQLAMVCPDSASDWIVDQRSAGLSRCALVGRGVPRLNSGVDTAAELPKARLHSILMQYLSANPIGKALTSPFEVDFEDESLVQPDLFVLPSSEVRRLNVAEWRPAESLLLAIEVLSPSSAGHDRRTKRPLYQRHVPEYWIVDIDARLVERWRPGDERPEIISKTLIWSPNGAAQPLAIEIDALFADLLPGDGGNELES